MTARYMISLNPFNHIAKSKELEAYANSTLKLHRFTRPHSYVSTDWQDYNSDLFLMHNTIFFNSEKRNLQVKGQEQCRNYLTRIEESRTFGSVSIGRCSPAKGQKYELPKEHTTTMGTQPMGSVGRRRGKIAKQERVCLKTSGILMCLISYKTKVRLINSDWSSNSN